MRVTKRVPIRGLTGPGTEAERVLHSTREPGFNDELGKARDAENEETTGHFGAGPEEKRTDEVHGVSLAGKGNCFHKS